MVEHPGLERHTAARSGVQAKRPALLWEIDQRAGGDQPVAASRGHPRDDAVAMRVPGEGGDHARRTVEQREQLLTALGILERLMGDHDHPPLTGERELLLQPGGLTVLDDAPGAAGAAYEVEHDQSHRVADVPYVVELPGGDRRSAQLRLCRGVCPVPQTADHLWKLEFVAAPIGRDL